MYTIKLFISLIFTINLNFGQGEGQTCIDEDDYLEGGLVRKTNKFSKKPMYSLEFKENPEELGKVYRREYKFYVSCWNIYKGITAVKIITKSNPYCGEGKFTFNSTDFYQTSGPNCNSVFESKSHGLLLKESPPLTWIPPLCGCVNFRAIVVYGKYYYKDDKGVDNGPLSQTICIEKQMNRTDYVKALCYATKFSRGITVIGDPYFLRRHQLDAMTVNGTRLLAALQTRWTQIVNCCTDHILRPEMSVNCMDDLKLQRIGNLCTNKPTDIPMVDYKAYYTLHKKEQCCHIRGMQKYECFGENGKLWDVTKDTLLDFSLEDTDPVNDLEIFGLYERWENCFDQDRNKGTCDLEKMDKKLLRYVSRVEFKPKTTNVDSYNRSRNETSRKKNTSDVCRKQQQDSDLSASKKETGWTCMDSYLDGTCVRGRLRNKFKKWNVPLFTLSISEIPAGVDGIYRREYKVEVSGRNSSRFFKDFKIIIKSNPYCGEGKFTYDNNEFKQSKDPRCDTVLETKTENRTTQSPPLTWSPPYCGCVKFRVIVLRGQYYFTDDESIDNGPLSQTVCVKKQYERLNYLQALCLATKSSSVIKVIGNQFFLSRHGLDPMIVDGLKLMESLQDRLMQIRKCCLETPPFVNVFCMDDIIRRRIAGFCVFNITELPIVNYKAHDTNERKQQCCRFLGEQLFICFGENVNITDLVYGTLLDYSKEDNDPANDLAIFGSVEDKEVLSLVTSIEFQNKTSTFDEYNDPFIRGSNMLNPYSSEKKLEGLQKQWSEKRLEKQCCKAGKESSKTKCKTSKAEHECEIGFHNFASRTLISDFNICEKKFVICCTNRRCCSDGKKYSSSIITREPMKVHKICSDSFWEYTVSRNLKSYLNICMDKFKKCCFKTALKISH